MAIQTQTINGSLTEIYATGGGVDYTLGPDKLPHFFQA